MVSELPHNLRVRKDGRPAPPTFGPGEKYAAEKAAVRAFTAKVERERAERAA
jgi:hypothetical protein